jgi:hypothetical protein
MFDADSFKVGTRADKHHSDIAATPPVSKYRRPHRAG